VFVPTLIAITPLGFMIMISAPGDLVERMVVAAQSGGEIGTKTANQIEQKKFWSLKLSLDLPIFYFSLNSLAQRDTLYRIYDRNEKEALSRLTAEYGNWAMFWLFRPSPCQQAIPGLMPDSNDCLQIHDQHCGLSLTHWLERHF